MLAKGKQADQRRTDRSRRRPCGVRNTQVDVLQKLGKKPIGKYIGNNQPYGRRQFGECVTGLQKARANLLENNRDHQNSVRLLFIEFQNQSEKPPFSLRRSRNHRYPPLFIKVYAT